MVRTEKRVFVKESPGAVQSESHLDTISSYVLVFSVLQIGEMSRSTFSDISSSALRCTAHNPGRRIPV